MIAAMRYMQCCSRKGNLFALSSVTYQKYITYVLMFYYLFAHVQACNTGFYGAECNETCSKRCLNNNCGPETDQCINGCETGYHGLTCDNECPVNCQNRRCEMFTGHCFDGCLPGYFDVNCTSMCPEHCISGLCSTSTGFCERGCDEGYEGPKCNLPSEKDEHEGLSNRDCHSGWFGPNCEYKCYCTESKCNKFGECLPGSNCVIGRFGFLCQYVDVVASLNMENGWDWLVDNNDNTCNPGSANVLDINLDVEFTFARIVVQKPEYLSAISLEFQFNTPCLRMASYPVSERARDIVCYNLQTVYKVVLTGEGVQSLCSVQISGGRNVALKQMTNLTTIAYTTPDKAVDGNTNQNFDHNSCVHSHYGDPAPELMVILREPKYIKRIVIYSRTDYQLRSKHSIIRLYDKDNNLVDYFQDKSEDYALIYTVRYAITRPIKIIAFMANYDFDDLGFYVNFCELEAYGDSDCPLGTYGLGCERTCPCIDSKCFSPTGGCFTGCKIGRKNTLGCKQECDTGFYGLNCKETCPKNCLNNECGPAIDKCRKGCTTGYHGMACDQECPVNCRNVKCQMLTGNCFEGCVDGYFGEKCEKNCSSNCLDATCFMSSGKCEHGCVNGFFGYDCSKLCSINCANSTCNMDTGTCIEGCTQGYFGLDCSKSCSVNCENVICNRDTGKCTEGCVVGYYGQTCEIACSVNCREKECNLFTGKCTTGCTPGHYGPKCGLTCPMYCKNKSCKFTGECEEGCSPGHYGKKCIYDCPANCRDRLCTSDTGTCVGGCYQGYYGKECLKDCPANCKNRLCNVATGKCEKGCEKGFHGPTCAVDESEGPEVLAVQEEDSTEEVPATTIWFGSVVIGLAVFGLLGFLALRRQRSAANDTSQEIPQPNPQEKK